jgi:hypothetical protein
MIRYYVTFEVYGERSCLQKLEEFCKERGLLFEYCERFDDDSYKEYKEEAKMELGFTDIFKAWITFKNTPNYERILSEMNERKDIDICIKIDM